MEPKKNPEADLSKKRFLFFNVGLVVALMASIFAFSFKTTYDTKVIDLLDTLSRGDNPVYIPITNPIPPPPPRVIQAKLVVVANTEEIKDQPDVDLEPDPEVLEIKPFIAVNPEVIREDPDEIFIAVEQSAAPEGGLDEFYRFISSKIKYPARASRMGIEGRVYVEFVVEKDGTLTDIKTTAGIGAGCDEEALRVVSMAPKWNPGKQRGKPVRQRMTIPINFRLN
jgi:protein TonB